MDNTYTPPSASTPTEPEHHSHHLSLMIVLSVFCVLGIVGSVFLALHKKQPTPQPVAKKDHLVKVTPLKKKTVDGQIVIKFKSTLTEDQIKTELAKYNASIKDTVPQIHTTVVRVPVGQEQKIINALQTAGFVESAEPNYIQQIQYIPNDPDFIKQWGLSNTGQSIGGLVGVSGVDTNIEKAWDKTKGAGVKVAVLDTGIDIKHPDLASKVIVQKGIATPTAEDLFGHGTHVAGIIAASTNNGQGIAGACPECQLMIVKVVGDQGNGTTADIATGITWAVDNGAQVINISAGGYEVSQAEKDAIAYAWSKNVIVVAAAGNNGTSDPFYPAAFPYVVSVGAITSSNTRAPFSDYGSWVQVMAPGTNIFSTLPLNDYRMQLTTPLANGYDYLSGTSMATPLVTGIIALLIADSPGVPASAIVNRLYGTADKISGTGQDFAYGSVDASAAIGPAATATPTITPTPTPTRIPPTATPTMTPSPTPTRIPTPTPTRIPPTPTFTPTPTTKPLSLSTPTPTPVRIATPTPTTVIAQISPTSTTSLSTPTPTLPDMYCLGSCPTGSVGITPGGTLSASPAVTSTPCKTTPEVKKKSGFGGLLSFIFKLLGSLFGMFGSASAPAPTTPNCPPTATPTSLPIGSLTPTGAPSASVTGTITPTAGAAKTLTMSNITFYGWPENGGASIAHPVIHTKAGGAGTYADPITFSVATNTQQIIPVGSKAYVPYLQKYFIMEDDCADCFTYQMRIWVNSDGTNNDKVTACETSLARQNIDVQLNPPSNLTVSSQQLFNLSSATCFSP